MLLGATKSNNNRKTGRLWRTVGGVKRSEEASVGKFVHTREINMLDHHKETDQDSIAFSLLHNSRKYQ